jgi:hypothetical protein
MQRSSSHRRRGLLAAVRSNAFVASLALLGALCTIPACARTNLGLDESAGGVGGAGGIPTTGSLTTGSLTTGSLTTGSLTTGSLTTGSLTTGSLTTGSLTTGSLTTG